MAFTLYTHPEGKSTLCQNLLVIYPEENKYPPYKPKYEHCMYFFISVSHRHVSLRNLAPVLRFGSSLPLNVGHCSPFP